MQDPYTRLRKRSYSTAVAPSIVVISLGKSMFGDDAMVYLQNDIKEIVLHLKLVIKPHT